MESQLRNIKLSDIYEPLFDGRLEIEPPPEEILGNEVGPLCVCPSKESGKNFIVKGLRPFRLMKREGWTSAPCIVIAEAETDIEAQMLRLRDQLMDKNVHVLELVRAILLVRDEEVTTHGADNYCRQGGDHYKKQGKRKRKKRKFLDAFIERFPEVKHSKLGDFDRFGCNLGPFGVEALYVVLIEQDVHLSWHVIRASNADLSAMKLRGILEEMEAKMREEGKAEQAIRMKVGERAYRAIFTIPNHGPETEEAESPEGQNPDAEADGDREEEEEEPKSKERPASELMVIQREKPIGKVALANLKPLARTVHRKAGLVFEAIKAKKSFNAKDTAGCMRLLDDLQRAFEELYIPFLSNGIDKVQE